VYVLSFLNHTQTVMFTKEDHEFIDMLFGKLTCQETMDVDMIDLHDDDAAGADAIEWTKLELS
jgi:hypothetical protein